MHSIKYYSGVSVLHLIYSTTRLQVQVTGREMQSYRAHISHILKQITTEGGGDYLPMTEKEIIKIITKTKQLGH